MNKIKAIREKEKGFNRYCTGYSTSKLATAFLVFTTFVAVSHVMKRVNNRPRKKWAMRTGRTKSGSNFILFMLVLQKSKVITSLYFVVI